MFYQRRYELTDHPINKDLRCALLFQDDRNCGSSYIHDITSWHCDAVGVSIDTSRWGVHTAALTDINTKKYRNAARYSYLPDKANDYFELSVNDPFPELSTTGNNMPFTLAHWIRMPVWDSNWEDVQVRGDQSISLRVHNNQYSSSIYTGSFNDLKWDTQSTEKSFRHWCLSLTTYDGDRNALYSNGILRTSATGLSNYHYQSAYNWRVHSNEQATRWSGLAADMVCWWARALNPGEVADLYRTTKDGSYGILAEPVLGPKYFFPVRQWRPSRTISSQQIQPDGDITDGNWLTDLGGTDLYTAIDEDTASDSDYIESGNNPSLDVCEVTLQNPTTISPKAASGHTVSYRYQKSAAAGRDIELRVRLLDNITEVASWTHSLIANGWTTATQTLDTTETSIITDWNDLRLEFRADVSGSGAGRRGQVSWAEMQVKGDPAPAPAGGPNTLTLLGVG